MLVSSLGRRANLWLFVKQKTHTLRKTYSSGTKKLERDLPSWAGAQLINYTPLDQMLQESLAPGW